MIQSLLIYRQGQAQQELQTAKSRHAWRVLNWLREAKRFPSGIIAMDGMYTQNVSRGIYGRSIKINEKIIHHLQQEDFPRRFIYHSLVPT